MKKNAFCKWLMCGGSSTQHAHQLSIGRWRKELREALIKECFFYSSSSSSWTEDYVVVVCVCVCVYFMSVYYVRCQSFIQLTNENNHSNQYMHRPISFKCFVAIQRYFNEEKSSRKRAATVLKLLKNENRISFSKKKLESIWVHT